MSEADFMAWGWRIPFVVGCMIVPFLFWIRRMLEETEAFSQRKTHPSMRQIVRSVGQNWALVLAGIGLFSRAR